MDSQRVNNSRNSYNSTINVKNHSRNDSNENRTTRINTQSPSFYNSDFSFKQKERSARGTALGTPVQVVV